MIKNERFVVVMEKEYIGYPLYKRFFNVLEPYSCLRRGRVVRKFRTIAGKLFKNDFFCFNKKLLDPSITTFLIYDTINPNIVKFIRQKNKKARIIIYYINPVRYSNDCSFYKSLGCETWSFDENDCKEFDMKWNPLHFFGEELVGKTVTKRDVFFIGADKGRYSQIIDIKNELETRGISCLFMITPNTNTPFYDKKKYSKRIRYSRNLELINESKAILDVMQKGQSGFTMRIPESMLNHKKLITDNTRIKNYPFYCKDNIFILGEDDIETIKTFVNAPWNHCKDEEIKDLSIKQWISKYRIDSIKINEGETGN